MVTVIGLGFVGLTTALGLAEYGHKVYGIEKNDERFLAISAGRLPFMEQKLDEALKRHINSNFIPTTDWEKAIANSDYIYYCVGTPYGLNGQADLTHLYNAIEQTITFINDNRFRVLVTKSTIPPSTTEKCIVPFLEKHGFKVPEQLGVANNPEFLREGHCWDDFIGADRIVIGTNDIRSEKMLSELYANAGVPVCNVSLNTSEFIKYLSNTSLACLISFANEMSLAADCIGGIDVSAAFRILHMDTRWKTGTIRSYFYPGCGYGGYCLPKDTNAFYAAVKSAGFDCSILKDVISVNDNMAKKTAQRIINSCGGNPETKIGILGLSFNAGSDDVRDAPSAKIIAALNKAGFHKILVYDPVAIDNFKQQYTFDYQCIYKYEDLTSKSDILVIVTPWQEFKKARNSGKPVVDCRYML